MKNIKKKYFQWTDAGQSISKRPKDKNACTVQTAAIAFNISYDESFEVMKKYGRNKNGMWLKQFNHALKFLAKKYQKTIKLIDVKNDIDILGFIHTHKNGTYIIDHYNHVSIIVNGIIMDHVETWNMPIERFWEINETK